ncbi:hypothetical protein Tco_1445230, partial [Tanacetum coccineum]
MHRNSSILDSCLIPGLDEVLIWLLVVGYQEVNAMLMKAIALLILAVGLSVGKNDGTTGPESIKGNDAYEEVRLVAKMQKVIVVDDTGSVM